MITEVSIWLNSNEDMVIAVYEAATVLLCITLVVSWGRNRYVERENHYLEIQRLLMQQYYEMLREQIIQTRKLRHDIANHLHTVETLEEDGRAETAGEYRQYLMERYQELKQAGYVSDPLVDAVLFQKVKFCREHGINPDIELMNLNLEGMEDFERMRFFFELTEYAIWKVMDSRAGETGGTIHLYTEIEKGYTLIGCELAPAVKKQTDKKMALGAIRQIAEGYHGFVKLEQSEKAQNVMVAFRISQSNG